MPNNSARPERLKKCCRHFGARIFELWRGFGEGAGLRNPVTEPKRPVRRSLGEGGSQSSKSPLSLSIFPNGYNIFENALSAMQ
jgi:hypothetical protein